MDKIVIIDYCDTLFRGQSLQLYIEYLYSKLRPVSIFNYFFRFLLKLPISIDNYKKYAFKGIAGTSKVDIEILSRQFYDDVLKPKHNSIIENIIYKHLEDKDKLIIASGGCIEYLKFLSKDYLVDVVIATDLKYDKNNRLIGLKYPECLYENKVFYVQEYFNSLNLEWDKTILYTDSPSDLPLLKKVNKGIVVGYSYETPEWIKRNFSYLKI
jgi:HAD superfamily phosphoserine phosphatase-like hydrolase